MLRYFCFYVNRRSGLLPGFVRSPADDMDPKPADRGVRRPIADTRVLVRGASQVDQLLDPGGRRDHCSR